MVKPDLAHVPIEIKLHPEEENILRYPSKYRHLTGETSSRKDDIKNVIASAIGNNDSLYVILKEEDCIGLRSIIVTVYIDKKESKNLLNYAKKIKNTLLEFKYSVSNYIELNKENDRKCKFRSSSQSIKKGD